MSADEVAAEALTAAGGASGGRRQQRRSVRFSAPDSSDVGDETGSSGHLTPDEAIRHASCPGVHLGKLGYLEHSTGGFSETDQSLLQLQYPALTMGALTLAELRERQDADPEFRAIRAQLRAGEAAATDEAYFLDADEVLRVRVFDAARQPHGAVVLPFAREAACAMYAHHDERAHPG